jgi:hypothetical protein
MISQAELKRRLHYDPDTGQFKWLIPFSNRVKAGDVAGWQEANGYICIRIDGFDYKAHRLAWLYMTGENPRHLIDHRNQVKDDNRFANLREATKSQNAANNHKPAKARYHWQSKLWQARVVINGKEKSRYFKTEAEAIEGRKILLREVFGEYAP